MSVTRLVYVHGTNGSGKSTLARAVLAAAGGAQGVASIVGSPKATYTATGAPALVLAGKYGNACGGVDGILPYALVHDVMRLNADLGRSVFAEGLVTPGLDTCRRFADYFTYATFVLLDTPIDQCIANVMTRRRKAGNTKPYDPANLYRKTKSAASWADRLERGGLVVHRVPFREARALCLDLLGLPDPDVNDLLT